MLREPGRVDTRMLAGERKTSYALVIVIRLCSHAVTIEDPLFKDYSEMIP